MSNRNPTRPNRVERKFRKMQTLRRTGRLKSPEVARRIWVMIQSMPNFFRVDWDALALKVTLDVLTKGTPVLQLYSGPKPVLGQTPDKEKLLATVNVGMGISYFQNSDGTIELREVSYVNKES